MKNNQLKLLASMVLLGISAFFFWMFFRGQHSPDEQTYFYDLSEQKLFAAPRSAVPPTRGLNNAEEDAVRAVVVSPAGDSGDKNRKIVYLEKYSFEMKRQFEGVRRLEADGKSSAGLIGHGQVPANTFVRRIDNTNWYPLISSEGEKIVSEWNTPGADGKYPVVCVP